MEMDSGRSWASMEADCLIEIFTKLGVDDLTLAVPFVCKSWRFASRHPICWKKLDFRRLNLLPWSRFARSFALRHSLPRFSFTYFLKFAINQGRNSATEIRFPLRFTSLQDLQIASNECKYLKKLALPVLSQGEELHVPELVCRWKDLEKLELESKPSNFVELAKNISLNCDRFSWLRISGSSIREDDASAIVKYLPKLRKLELIGSHLPKEYLMIILNGCRELASLNVIGCIGFNGEDEEISSQISQIKDFKQEGCKLFYEPDYEADDSSDDFGFEGYIL